MRLVAVVVVLVSLVVLVPAQLLERAAERAEVLWRSWKGTS